MSLGDEHGYGGPARGGPDLGERSGQTRTRLPESDSGPFGSSRRTGRSSRGLVPVVTVVVLLIAAIAFANRSGGGSDGADEAAEKPETAATAATGERPVSTKTAGIPSGFAHDQQGAQSAATNYAVALGSDAMVRKDSRHQIVAALYTTGAADQLIDALDKAYSPEVLGTMGLDADGNPPRGNTFVSRTIPVGTKVEHYTNDRAKIAVWFMGLTGVAGEKSTEPVTSSWQTTTFDLQWSNNDWKIISDTETNGPAPVPGDDRASSADEIAQAVEGYGGFTYAR